MSEINSAVEELARAASPAVVQIAVKGRGPVDGNGDRGTGFVAEQQATGSGVILDASGYIVTNAHVIEGARHIDVSVITQGQDENSEGHGHFTARVVGTDRETDLAVLKIDSSNLSTLPLSDSDNVKQGEIVLALGSPLGLDNSLTVGVVSSPHRHLRPDQPVYYIQTDAPINPGNSGGPLLGSDGSVVGINTLIFSQSGGNEGIGFAIPSKLVDRIYRQLRDEGRIRRSFIGILASDITPTLASALGVEHNVGVIISDVTPHSPAEAAGLQTGDIILALNGRPVREMHEVIGGIYQLSIGDVVTLDILRGSTKLPTKVALRERPSTPGDLADLPDRDDDLLRQIGILAVTVDEKVTSILPGLRRLYGVIVAAIPVEFAALNPGLLTGDVIYEFNGKQIKTLEMLRDTLATTKPEAPVALLVEREGRLIYIPFQME